MKVRRKRVCRCVIWILFFLFLILEKQEVCASKEPEAEDIHALSAVLMDAKSGRVLYTKSGDVMRPMASTTKILTCIIALEECSLDEVVSVSALAASQPAVHLNMHENQQFYLKDLLYSLMLESHNDTAVAIAEHVGGTVEGFAEKMNQKAKELGCFHSYFITPNGLDAEDENGVHSISAENLALIMSYCICQSKKSEAFLEITQTNTYTFQDLRGEKTYTCQNHNAFLQMMDGALTGKTGYTGGAGYCYVGALKSEKRIFVVALLGSGWPNQKNYKWQDVRKLMTYGLENYIYKNIAVSLEIPELLVLNGRGKETELFEKVKVPLKIESDSETLEILMNDTEHVHGEITKPTMIEAPVLEGQKMGSITYYIDDEVIRTFPIVSSRTVEVRDYMWILKKIIEKYSYID